MLDLVVAAEARDDDPETALRSLMARTSRELTARTSREVAARTSREVAMRGERNRGHGGA
jgi:hypothetical protein